MHSRPDQFHSPPAGRRGAARGHARFTINHVGLLLLIGCFRGLHFRIPWHQPSGEECGRIEGVAAACGRRLSGAGWRRRPSGLLLPAHSGPHTRDWKWSKSAGGMLSQPSQPTQPGQRQHARLYLWRRLARTAAPRQGCSDGPGAHSARRQRSCTLDRCTPQPLKLPHGGHSDLQRPEATPAPAGAPSHP